MDKKIFWFSGSGNSLYAAKRLREGLEGSELVPIPSSMGEVSELPKVMGLVFPVYAWGPPEIVGRFIGSLPEGSPDYIFAVATCGSSPGSTMSITKRLLKKRGLRLDAALTVKMVENYPPLGGAPGEERQQSINARAEEEIEDIVQKVSEGFRGTSGANNPFFSVIGRIVYPLFRSHVSRAADKFTSDESCTSCGVCARICPVDNIELKEGRPFWGDRCQQCFACFHWCPENSVQFGKKSKDQPRYHHPGVGLADMTGIKDGD